MQDLCTTLRFYPIFKAIFMIYSVFVWYCAHLFVPLSFRSKVLPFDNKSKKIDFCFVLCSLIRTFANDHRHDVQV